MYCRLTSIGLKIAVVILAVLMICVENTHTSRASNLEMNYIALNSRTGVIYGNFPQDPELVSFFISMDGGSTPQSIQINTFRHRNGRYYGTGFYLSDYQEYIDNIITGNVHLTMVVSANSGVSQTVVGRLRWGISPGMPGVPAGGDYITVELE